MKYSAKDFENAQFAKHPASGKVAAKIYPFGFPEDDEPREWESANDCLANSAMASDGWVPVPTKPTITVSQYRELIEDLERRTTVPSCAFERAGIEIVPDPEPADEEILAKYLNTAGVTANKEKGNND